MHRRLASHLKSYVQTWISIIVAHAQLYNRACRSVLWLVIKTAGSKVFASWNMYFAVKTDKIEFFTTF